MRPQSKQLRDNLAFSMAAPFALYFAFLVLQEVLAKSAYANALIDTRMIYPVKAICVAMLLAYFWRCYKELANFSLRMHEVLLGIATGVGVFLLWINLDQGWMSVGHSAGFDPRDSSGEIDWNLAVPRLLGAAVVVPVMEELFWRSFFLRWIAHPKFFDVTPARAGLKALLLSSAAFGLEHDLWLAGMVAGLAYGWLYMKSNKLWVPILAHATTNGILGLWVLHSGEWSYW
jgi:CAAX prenyl protease-like protein